MRPPDGRCCPCCHAASARKPWKNLISKARSRKRRPPPSPHRGASRHPDARSVTRKSKPCCGPFLSVTTASTSTKSAKPRRLMTASTSPKACGGSRRDDHSPAQCRSAHSTCDSASALCIRSRSWASHIWVQEVRVFSFELIELVIEKAVRLVRLKQFVTDGGESVAPTCVVATYEVLEQSWLDLVVAHECSLSRLRRRLRAQYVGVHASRRQA